MVFILLDGQCTHKVAFDTQFLLLHLINPLGIILLSSTLYNPYANNK